LNDESLVTLLAHVEWILNSRPLSSSSDDSNDLHALTPNHVLLPDQVGNLPIGLVQSNDNYCRKTWKQVQYLSNVFWKRWILEYRNQLQKRSKWLFKQRNIQVGDLVLLENKDVHRGQWPL
jgi:hypothetical protein